MTLEEERIRIAENPLKSSKEEVAILRDNDEDLLEDDKYVLPVEQSLREREALIKDE